MGAWTMFLDAIFSVIHWFYTLVGDWGFAIVMITVVFRILVFPITRKQAKSSYQMQKLQPQIKLINERFANDPQRKNEETLKVYQTAKFNPIAGCLPTLLQIPIFMALFSVLRGLADVFDQGVNAPYTFSVFVSDITLSTQQVFGESGLFEALPYLVLLALFGLSMTVPMLLNQQTGMESMGQSKVMMVVMVGVMLFVGWGASAGVLIYWVFSSYIGIFQQQISRNLLKRKDERQQEELIEVTPVKVDVARAERKARPRKKN